MVSTYVCYIDVRTCMYLSKCTYILYVYLNKTTIRKHNKGQVSFLPFTATTEMTPGGFSLHPRPTSIQITWSDDGCPPNYNQESFFIRVHDESFMEVFSTHFSHIISNLIPFTNYTFVFLFKCHDLIGSQVLNTEPSSPIQGATEQGSKYSPINASNS